MRGADRPIEGQPAALDVVAAVAAELGAEDLRTEAIELQRRLAEGRFYVACVGQFKRGKSTLINALIGHDVLPTGVVPITSIPTVIRFGDCLAVRVRLSGQSWRDADPASISDFVAEDRNPRNRKGVEAIELYVTSPLLADGMCLVDTPGLGSVFEWNADATRAFVPHIDAAIVVLGADPPLAREELDLIADIAGHTDDLILVINKADRHTEAERREASAFTQRVLQERLGREIGEILAVSALEQTRGRRPDAGWAELTTRLNRLSAESGRALTGGARARGTLRLVDWCLGEIREAREVLRRPLAESERRLDELRRTIADLAHQSLRLGHMFAAEQEQLDHLFQAEHDTFVRRTQPDAARELAVAVGDIRERWGPSARRCMLEAAQRCARRHIEPWLAAQQATAEDRYREVANRFVELANDFLARAQRSGVPGLEHLPPTMDREQTFRTRSGFWFTELVTLAYPLSPGQWLLDVLRPRAMERRALLRVAEGYLDRLFEVNSARVQNDLRERVFESRRQLEAAVHRRLQRVYETAQRALERGRHLHAAGAGAVAEQLRRLDDLQRTIEAVRLAPIDGDATASAASG